LTGKSVADFIKDCYNQPEFIIMTISF